MKLELTRDTRLLSGNETITNNYGYNYAYGYNIAQLWVQPKNHWSPNYRPTATLNLTLTLTDPS